MVAVGDVERRHPGKRVHEGAGVLLPGAPHRVPDGVGRREVVQRLAGADARRDRVEIRCAAVGQEDDARLRLQLDDVPRAVVLLVAPRTLVLLDAIRFVFVDRKTAGDARLLVVAHAQPVEIERGRLVDDERRPLPERVEVRARLRVHLRRVGIRAVRQVDLRSGDVQETEGIVGGELSGFVRVDNVVWDG
jgi:hypothetical protein